MFVHSGHSGTTHVLLCIFINNFFHSFRRSREIIRFQTHCAFVPPRTFHLYAFAFAFAKILMVELVDNAVSNSRVTGIRLQWVGRVKELIIRLVHHLNRENFQQLFQFR